MGKAATSEHDTKTKAEELHASSPECDLCDRTLLVGEDVHSFEDRNQRHRSVCDLCRPVAVRQGWTMVASNRPRKRIRAIERSPLATTTSAADVTSMVEVTALTSTQPAAPVRGKSGVAARVAAGRAPSAARVPMATATNDVIQYLRGQLGPAGEDSRLHGLPAEILGSIADKLERQERELQRLRKEADPIRREYEQRALAEQSTEIQDLRTQLRDRERKVGQLETARRVEADPVAVCRHAVDAFNMSEHADRMLRIARTLGDPDVWVHDQGMALPRMAHVTLAWDIAWYRFRVKLDLGAGRASVHEFATGGEPSDLGLDRSTRNASWRQSGLVLSNADLDRAVAPTS